MLLRIQLHHFFEESIKYMWEEYILGFSFGDQEIISSPKTVLSNRFNTW